MYKLLWKTCQEEFQQWKYTFFTLNNLKVRESQNLQNFISCFNLIIKNNKPTFRLILVFYKFGKHLVN